MSHNQRGIRLFMVAGSVLAVVIGLTVWNTSTPQRSVTAGYTQEVEETATGGVVAAPAPQSSQTPTLTQTRATSPASSRSAGPKPAAQPSAQRRRTADAGYDPLAPAGGSADEAVIQAAPAQGRYRMEDDPLAPPHAVTSQPPTVQPTTHYRPTNARQEQSSDAAQEQSSAPRPTAVRTTPQPPSTSVPSTQSQQTSQPAQPAQPTQPSRTDEPTTPDAPATESARAPHESGGDAPLASEEAPSVNTSSAAEEPTETRASEVPIATELDADDENLGGLLPG